MKTNGKIVALFLGLLLVMSVGLAGDEPAAPAVPAAPADAAAPAEAPALTPEQKEVQKLRQRKERLELENALRQETQRQDLATVVEEKDKLTAESELDGARLKKALNEMEQQRARLELEAALMAKQHEIELAKLEIENKRLTLANQTAELKAQQALAELTAKKQALELEQAIGQQQLQKELAEVAAQRQRLELDNQRATLELQKKALAHQARRQEAEQEIASLETDLKKLTLQHSLAMQKMTNEHARAQQAAALLTTRLQQRGSKETWEKETNKNVPYPDNPLIDGVLHISDRRIELDDLIIEGTAQYVGDRLHFFNNQSTKKPIFIIITDCVGGSVMEGYRIIKAIESSEAPCHVVAKSFAASMAAVIVAQAEHSYAYPSTVFIQHQIRSWGSGNTTQIAEELEDMKRWQQRLLGPVAKKMGVSVDQLIKQMYEHNSEGEWKAFGDEARKLKWVNTVVHEVREEGVTKKPEGGPPEPWFFELFEWKKDESGRKYAVLPRLRPMDFYFLYNPDNFYR